MGYTHYFKQSKPASDEQWQAFQKDAKVVIEHAQKNLGIVLISNDDNGVIINNERINLNGDSDNNLDHETFFLSQNYSAFNFCKTALKPYDTVVCSLLLLANEHMPNQHEISSDGGFDEWQRSMEINAKIFGYAFKLPERVESSEEVTLFEDELQKTYSKKTGVTNSPVENKKDIFESNKKSSRFNL